MKIRKFEDIEAWQEARNLVNIVYELTRNQYFTKDYGLKDQVRRAAISIMANIAEGFDRKSRKEFLRFLAYSLSSVSEVKSHIYIALDQNYITSEQFRTIFLQAEKVSKMLTGFMKYLRSLGQASKPTTGKQKNRQTG